MNIYDFVQRRVHEKKVQKTIAQKYQPHSVADLAGLLPDMAVLCVNQWIRTRSKRFLMVSGPTGVGKTTLVRLALAEAGFVPIDVPCSIVKTAKDFEILVRSVTDRHALLVDELDIVEPVLGTTVKDFAKTRPNVPIAFVCQKHTYGKAMDFAKASEVVQLRRPSRTRLIDWVQTIVQKESIQGLDAAALVDQSKGDISQILVTLELNRGQTSGATALMSKKDPPLDAIGTVEMLMCSTSPLTASLAMRLTSLDPTIVGSMVSENYVDVAIDIDAAAEAAEALSVADVMEDQMYGHQCWELWDPWTFFGAVYPASRVRRKSTHAIRFTKIWSKLSNMYLRKGYLSSLKATIGMGLDSDYVYALSRCMFFSLVSSGAGAESMVALYGRLVPYELVTFVLRLSMKTDLKQAAINKIKAAYKKGSVL